VDRYAEGGRSPDQHGRWPNAPWLTYQHWKAIRSLLFSLASRQSDVVLQLIEMRIKEL
jgi:hypothetical protein